MTQEEFTRLLGCRDGLSHALISVGSVRSALTGPANAYLPPKRHWRKRLAVTNKVDELDRVSVIIQRQLDSVKDAINSHVR